MYFKYSHFIYLVVAIFFLADAVMRFTENENYYISLAFFALAVFMFFFRRNSYRKFNNRNNQ